MAGRQLPVTDIDSCNTTVFLGCIVNPDDPRHADCGSRDAGARGNPPYCWPFPLWHVGDVYTSVADGLSISVDAAISGGYRITVRRIRPNIAQLPHLCLVGCGRFISPDDDDRYRSAIWVDSAANGFESKNGAGLEFGRDKAGNAIGGGDMLYPNVQNRIYARVVNIGSGGAKQVRVSFQMAPFANAGIPSGSGWRDIGSAVISIPPRAASDAVFSYTSKVPAYRPALRVVAEDVETKTGSVSTQESAVVLKGTKGRAKVTISSDANDAGSRYRIFSVVLPTLRSGVPAVSIGGPQDVPVAAGVDRTVGIQLTRAGASQQGLRQYSMPVWTVQTLTNNAMSPKDPARIHRAGAPIGSIDIVVPK